MSQSNYLMIYEKGDFITIKGRLLLEMYEMHQIFIEIGFQNKKDALIQFDKSKYCFEKNFPNNFSQFCSCKMFLYQFFFVLKITSILQIDQIQRKERRFFKFFLKVFFGIQFKI